MRVSITFDVIVLSFIVLKIKSSKDLNGLSSRIFVIAAGPRPLIPLNPKIISLSGDIEKSLLEKLMSGGLTLILF
jgi:hypothetical protein